jgi:hypothetical protein
MNRISIMSRETDKSIISAPPPPRLQLSIGITGHRASNAAFAGHRDQIDAALGTVFDGIARVLAFEAPTAAPVRLHTLLSDGTDQLAAAAALARGWELVAPLPFGRVLNLAINAHPADAAGARALLAGDEPACTDLCARAEAIRSLYAKARLFELADADAWITDRYLATLGAPSDVAVAQQYLTHASERVALAGRVMIEQSDIVIAVWDGASRAFVGGTGHTIAAALDLGAPVVLVDANRPEVWRVLRTLESLTHSGKASTEECAALLAGLVKDALSPGGEGQDALADTTWRSHSNPFFHAYRQV